MSETRLTEEELKEKFYFESTFARFERIIKWLCIIILILIIALIGTNAGWIYWESQWQYVESTTVTQDLDASDGGNAVINDGVHFNGESETNGINN